MKKPARFERVNFCEQAWEIERILQAAVREAIAIHKKLGHSIVISKDGKVVVIPSDEIELPPEPESSV